MNGIDGPTRGLLSGICEDSLVQRHGAVVARETDPSGSRMFIQFADDTVYDSTRINGFWRPWGYVGKPEATTS